VKTTYISQIIEQVNAVTEHCGPVLLYGENIDTGSRIAGLARGLKVNAAGKILNVGNCELTHCGVGLGMMLDGGHAVLFMKQLDFLLLGLDQLVNTFNFIRAYRRLPSLGSFTIFLIVCDQGYQGPQSSLNSPGDFASLANIEVYCLNGAGDASYVIRGQFVKPGLRVICTSQRLFGALPLERPIEARASGDAIFKYLSGNDITVVCFNFALREGLAITDHLRFSGIHADLFHVNFVPDMDMSMLVESCARTGKLVILDDSKTVTKFGDALVTQLSKRKAHALVQSLTRRGCADQDYGVANDQFLADRDAVLAFARQSSPSETVLGAE